MDECVRGPRSVALARDRSTSGGSGSGLKRLSKMFTHSPTRAPSPLPEQDPDDGDVCADIKEVEVEREKEKEGASRILGLRSFLAPKRTKSLGRPIL